jgi:DNA polymerase III alpha subunit
VEIEQVAQKFQQLDIINLIMVFAKNKIGQSTISSLIYTGYFDEKLGDKDRHYLLINLPELIKKSISLLPNGALIIKPILDQTPSNQEELKKIDEQKHTLLGI